MGFGDFDDAVDVLDIWESIEPEHLAQLELEEALAE